MLLRHAVGGTLRDARNRQNRTLRDVSTAANVSLGYLSEVERGRKEASSELLASICDALDVQVSDLLVSVSRTMQSELVPVGPALHDHPANPQTSRGPQNPGLQNSGPQNSGLQNSIGRHNTGPQNSGHQHSVGPKNVPASSKRPRTGGMTGTSIDPGLRIVVPYGSTVPGAPVS